MVDEKVEEEKSVVEETLMGLSELAMFATKAVYTSSKTGKKLYEHTVEEARALVVVRNQDKVKKEGTQALGLNLGRNLLSLDKLKADATRLVCFNHKVKSITAALIAHVKAGVFDEEIAVSLAQTKATAEKMAETANAKLLVDADVPTDGAEVTGLDLEALGTDEADTEALVEDTGEADIPTI